MSDARGREHVFRFRTHLFADGVTIDAIGLNEDQSEGYCFKVNGHVEGDLLELLVGASPRCAEASQIRTSKRGRMDCKSATVASFPRNRERP